MANANAVFPSKYLKAAEIKEDTVLTMTGYQMETLGQGDDAEEKPVIYFEETEKGLACNKTNWETIIGIYGDETDDWIGKPITLFSTEVAYGGKMQMGIRIRLKKPAPARPAPRTTAPAKPSNGSPGAKPEAAARAKAWAAFCEKTPSFDDDEAGRKTNWTAALNTIFPGQKEKDLSVPDWQHFKAEVEANYDEATADFCPV